MTGQRLDMNFETRSGARTKFSPWFGFLHVNLGCFINHDVHELVEALQKMNEGRSAFSYCALESSTENGVGSGGRGGANGDVNTKDNFRPAIHPDTTRVACSNSGVGCGLEMHARLYVLQCASLYCRTAKSRPSPSAKKMIQTKGVNKCV